jgi:hypothetical protein
MSLKRKYTENSPDETSRKINEMYTTFNHKVERTRDEIREVENRMLVLEKMACQKTHLVALAARIMEIETYMSDVLPKLTMFQEALKCCATQEECLTYVSAIEKKLKLASADMKETVEGAFNRLNEKAEAAIHNFDKRMGELVMQTKELPPNLSKASGTQVERSLMRLEDFDLDLKAPFYMDGLRSLNGAAVADLSQRDEIYRIFRQWFSEGGNWKHVRRTKKRGKECYGLLRQAVPDLLAFVVQTQKTPLQMSP